MLAYSRRTDMLQRVVVCTGIAAVWVALAILFTVAVFWRVAFVLAAAGVMLYGVWPWISQNFMLPSEQVVHKLPTYDYEAATAQKERRWLTELQISLGIAIIVLQDTTVAAFNWLDRQFDKLAPNDKKRF